MPSIDGGDGLLHSVALAFQTDCEKSRAQDDFASLCAERFQGKMPGSGWQLCGDVALGVQG